MNMFLLIIPIIKANEKGLKTSPPYIYNTITTIRVVIDVIKFYLVFDLRMY